MRRKGALADRAPFFLIAILGLPLLVALLRPEGSALPAIICSFRWHCCC
ncbi:hypothetical protein ACFSTI_17825 [Rhizorhabdus histidinilytica]